MIHMSRPLLRHPAVFHVRSSGNKHHRFSLCLDKAYCDRIVQVSMVTSLADAAQASILHYAQRITSAASEGASVVDCVIVVPPFFGPPQRQALIDAAQLAGLFIE